MPNRATKSEFFGKGWKLFFIALKLLGFFHFKMGKIAQRSVSWTAYAVALGVVHAASICLVIHWIMPDVAAMQETLLEARWIPSVSGTLCLVPANPRNLVNWALTLRHMTQRMNARLSSLRCPRGGRLAEHNAIAPASIVLYEDRIPSRSQEDTHTQDRSSEDLQLLRHT
ncbi:hypothetical protein PR048_032300 [Dryococelus australis]|uniref:Uncharacterized protein n=1 Tax=Dryococelus australis TaxID=614101 RepID=A0ABQ9G4V7_9NEOP|nr:hypothetical protein PR048_032300 [Dryococelus australis]